MSLTIRSASPSVITDPDLPIAMRPAVSFEPARGSIFDDPGDEKSWHISQRSSSLTRYFEDREPSWYASAIAPLRGAERVLDLGCGPGLTLRALLEQGSSYVLGLDRWPAFTSLSTPEAPIVAHDLTLPFPFLESASFDGVLSHYALDYVSPIAMRQVLREAHRVLVPGGALLIYVAAVGLGSGDEGRTAAYSPVALRALLEEAGFGEIDVVASPNGRNSVARARRPSRAVRESWPSVGATIDGDTQVSARLPAATGRLEFELLGAEPGASLRLELPGPSQPEAGDISVCARVQHAATGVTELQLWSWRDFALQTAESVRVEFEAAELRIGSGVGAEHVSVWSPGEISVESPGSAYASPVVFGRGDDLSEAERGAEGRRVFVESAADEGMDLASWLGPGRNRFLLRRASGLSIASIEQEWAAGLASGIVFDASDLAGDRSRELLLWAGWRQALVYVRGETWEDVHAAVSARQAELGSPVVLVDPAVGAGAHPQPLPAETAGFVHARDRLFVLLCGESRTRSAQEDLQGVKGRLLHGGDDGEGDTETDETLRYLTERTLLMSLRQRSGCSWIEVGRRPALS